MNLRMVIPIEIGAIALLAGSYLAYANLRAPEEPHPKPSATPTAAKTIDTNPVVSKKGGFEIGVPEGVMATKKAGIVTLSADDKTFVVVAGLGASGTLADNGKLFVRAMRTSYTQIKVFGTKEQRVDGRKALATYGQAVNSAKVKIRFVNLVVKARPRNFVINSFAGIDTDPVIVLPQVNAIVGSFAVRK